MWISSFFSLQADEETEARRETCWVTGFLLFQQEGGTGSSGRLSYGTRHMNSHTRTPSNKIGSVYKGVFLDAKVFLWFLSSVFFSK